MAMVTNLLAKPGALRTLEEARAILKDITPMKMNCGRLCDAACCQSDESGENGMLLFPFEEHFYEKPIEGFPFHLADDDTLFEGGKRLVCEGKCVREHRPLACRIFPLRMSVKNDGHVEAEIDPRAWCVCPILEQGGMRAMSQDFIEAVRLCGECLMKNTHMLEALYNEQRLMNELTSL